jgi:DNA-binding beta-propeller fold protein YncE
LLLQPRRPVVSPDGKNVYVPSFDSHAVAVFTRDLSNGSLTQQASATLANATSVAISPDARTVYVTSSSGIVQTFDRDLVTGALIAKAGIAGCVSETGNGITCADGKALLQAQEAAVSADGRSVYVASAGTTDALAIFDRDPVTGQLTQQGGVAGCFSETGTAGACIDGVALDTVTGVTVSPDGATVYAIADTSGSVVILDRAVPVYDIDGDGQVDALTDALLLLRHTFGLEGASLINGAVDAVNCIRCTAPAIDAYIDALRGP